MNQPGFELSDAAFDALVIACRDHSRGRTSPDPTIGSCWDADRLDLLRCGIHPRDRFLSTAAARGAKLQRWAAAITRGQVGKPRPRGRRREGRRRGR